MFKKYCYISLFLLIATSCKVQPGTDGDFDKYDPEKKYLLQLNPAPGSTYYYTIINESEVNAEVDGTETGNSSKATVGINYEVDKDSTGNLLFRMTYDTIHLYTKNGDIEMDRDAANAAVSADLAEKMLGALKEATIFVSISPAGEIKNVNGYQEVGEKIISVFAPGDLAAKNAAGQQWEKMIGQGMIKKNIDQLFSIFPDSAIHLHDTWKLASRQEGDFNLVARGFYTLKAINSDVAIISCEGKITSDNNAKGALGYSGSTVNITGNQEAEFEMETKTGMLISCKIKTNAEGTLTVMGKEVPVTIKASVNMNGKKK